MFGAARRGVRRYLRRPYQAMARRGLRNAASFAKRTGKRGLSYAAGAATYKAARWVGSKAIKYGKSALGIHQRAKNSGAGGSESSFFYGRRRIPAKYLAASRWLQHQYYVKNGAGRTTSTVGVQQSNTPLVMFNTADLETMFGIQGAGKTEKMLFESCSAELQITNQDLATCRITLYDIIQRRDGNATNVSDPNSAWQNSYGDMLGGSNSNCTIPGVTPFSSDLFVQYFKVLKATHLMLAQGQVHVHRVNFSPNRMFDREIDQYQLTLKGLTCFTMIVYSGVPENDSVTKTSVSLGVSTLDYVYRKQYKFKYMTQNISSISATNSLSTSFAVAEDIIDIGAGTVVTDSNA